MSKEYLEAFEIIKKYAKNDGWADGWTIEFWNMTEKELTILDKVFKNEIPKKGLMDYNPTKHYLKWEDLEKDRTYKVLLNDIEYELVKRYDDYEYHCDYITLQKKPNVSIFFYEWDKEIFNDLRLERVE